MDTCVCCGQPIADGKVCADCERELGGNYRIEGRTVYIPADYYPGQTDGELMDPLGATLTEAEQRERFGRYGRREE